MLEEVLHRKINYFYIQIFVSYLSHFKKKRHIACYSCKYDLVKYIIDATVEKTVLSDLIAS